MVTRMSEMHFNAGQTNLKVLTLYQSWQGERSTRVSKSVGGEEDENDLRRLPILNRARRPQSVRRIKQLSTCEQCQACEESLIFTDGIGSRTDSNVAEVEKAVISVSSGSEPLKNEY